MSSTRKVGNFTYNVSNNVFYKKNAENIIYALGVDQLKKIGNVFLLDIFLHRNNDVELHYHPNATELTYCISGKAEVGFVNLETKEWETLIINRGEVITIPQGWWHYVKAKEDHTHLLAIHDTKQLETVFGSDILRLTPNETFAHMYCLDEKTVEKAFRPIDETVIIGPPADCSKRLRDKSIDKKLDDSKVRQEKKQNVKKKASRTLWNNSKYEMDHHQLDPFYVEYNSMPSMTFCPICMKNH